jgi:hypothetical protein
VLHAYGVVRAGARVRVPAAGVDGSLVEIVEVGRLAALVSRLDAERYGEGVWRERAEDPDWLAAFDLEHQEVLGVVAASCDVVPFRIPGMYDDPARLRAALENEQALLGRGLEAVRDHVEWGVRVFLTAAVEREPVPRPRSGSDYLRSRSRQADLRERVADGRRSYVLDAYGVIADAVTRSVATPPQDPALSSRLEPMLLNSAHLVPRSREDAFFEVLLHVQKDLADLGMVLEVRGPAPPYSFVHLATDELQDTP